MAASRVGTYSPFEPLSEQAVLSLDSMEGLPETGVIRVKKKADPLWPGYAIASIVAVAAYVIQYLPVSPFLVDNRRPISASIIAIVVSVLVRNLYQVPSQAMAGCKHIVRALIPAAIVLTGAGLNLREVAGVGGKALLVTIVCMLLATVTAIGFGRWLGLYRRTAMLIGAGTAICGTSAIVATAPVIEAEDEDVTLAVGTVSLLGLVLMFALPVVGNLLGMSQSAFGVWAGTSIHAVPQVVAAGFTYGPEAGSLATLVKLARVTLLAPFLLVLMLFYGRKKNVQVAKLIPAFVWGFLILAVMNTISLVPAIEFKPVEWLWGNQPMRLALSEVGNWILTLAMAAIGLEVNLRLLIHVGTRALAAGVGAMIVLCAASWTLIRILL